MDRAAIITQGEFAVARQQKRPIKIDIVSFAGKSRAGAMAATFRPCSRSSPESRQLWPHEAWRSLSQPASLVQLDIDGVIKAGKPQERGPVMHALIRADRTGRGSPRSASSWAAGKGCSTSNTPALTPPPSIADKAWASTPRWRLQ